MRRSLVVSGARQKTKTTRSLTDEVPGGAPSTDSLRSHVVINRTIIMMICLRSVLLLRIGEDHLTDRRVNEEHDEDSPPEQQHRWGETAQRFGCRVTHIDVEACEEDADVVARSVPRLVVPAPPVT